MWLGPVGVVGSWGGTVENVLYLAGNRTTHTPPFRITAPFGLSYHFYMITLQMVLKLRPNMFSRLLITKDSINSRAMSISPFH